VQVINKFSQIAMILVSVLSGACLVQAMEKRRCGLMINGKIQAIETCLFREYMAPNSVYMVRTNNARYRLDANSNPPSLSVNGELTSAGGGSYIRSSSRDCDLFIALADPSEGFNLSYSNVPRGLCVLQKDS